MERVEGDVYDVDELAHVIQDDAESAWILASRGDEALGCGVGRPVLDRRQPVRDGARAARAAGTRSRDELYEALSKHAAGLGLTSLWGRIREDDAASRRFAEHRGFREVSREYEVVLDVAAGRASRANRRPASSS